MLEIKNLSAFYGNSRALQNVTLEVGDAGFLSVLGRNGVGKTTLLRSIVGLMDKNDGSIRLDGEEIAATPTHDRVRHGIGYVPQGRDIFLRLSVQENLQMGLASKANVSATQLSQVELRKMELARAMATHPKLLISDEAMAGLSSSEVDEVLDLLLKLASQDITIIMIEHIMQAVMRFSERVMCLDAGRIIAIGTPSEVMANQRVQEAYLGT